LTNKQRARGGVLPPDLRHGEPDEALMHLGDCLHVRGEDLRVFCQVDKESVARPMPLDLHYLERRSSKQILQHRANTDSMPLVWIQTSRPCCSCHRPH
ncbi:hypothetical protein K443DRAFT_108600, partial [Laccaria amethystina LaAM-08-1]